LTTLVGFPLNLAAVSLAMVRDVFQANRSRHPELKIRNGRKVDTVRVGFDGSGPRTW
jgi:hypothetical protein